MLRSPMFTAFDALDRAATAAWENPRQAAGLLRAERIGLPCVIGLMLLSFLLPMLWIAVLTLAALAACLAGESIRSDDLREKKAAHKRGMGFPEGAEGAEAVAERARALGLTPEDYEAEEELVLSTGKRLNVTQLGQAVRHYAYAKPLLAEYASKVKLPCVPVEDGGDPEFCRLMTEGKDDIPPVSDAQASEINTGANLRQRLAVLHAVCKYTQAPPTATRFTEGYLTDCLWLQGAGRAAPRPCAGRPPPSTRPSPGRTPASSSGIFHARPTQRCSGCMIYTSSR